jgi:hypothetical protein
MHTSISIRPSSSVPPTHRVLARVLEEERAEQALGLHHGQRVHGVGAVEGVDTVVVVVVVCVVVGVVGYNKIEKTGASTGVGLLTGTHVLHTTPHINHGPAASKEPRPGGGPQMNAVRQRLTSRPARS